MKMSILVFFKMMITFFLLPSLVEAKLLMSVILNGGVFPTEEGYSCNTNDALLIQNTIGTEDDDDDRRKLAPKKCKDQCAGLAAGSCMITGCKKYRRRTLRATTTVRRLDDDDDEARCESGLVALNKELDMLLPKLSVGCRSVVKDKRVVSCFDDVRYAKVESFNMWNADIDTIVKTNIPNNFVFCYTGSKLDIEAVANACVEEMDISIKGKINRSREIETTGPYSVFGNTGTNFVGRILPVGTYTVKTTLEGSLTPTSQVTFTVKTC